MVDNSYIKKHPCRICRKWFIPNPRVGDRQKTCGSDECKQKWHNKKCAQWNRKNRATFQTNYLDKKLQAVKNQGNSPDKPLLQVPQSGQPPKLPQELIQEVIGAQEFVIAQYLSQVLLRSVQEVIRSQRSDIFKEVKRLPQSDHSRGDSQLRPP
jgi:hypothetical protein